jgi:hypothetical protein
MGAELETTNGRSMKFTPERLNQIKNLVERGISREEIAETIGVTLGSLQVTCSKHGISLRRPKIPGLPRCDVGGANQMNNNGNMRNRTVSICLRYREREVEIPLDRDTIGQLALEAEFCHKTMGEMMATLIAEALEARDKK